MVHHQASKRGCSLTGDVTDNHTQVSFLKTMSIDECFIIVCLSSEGHCSLILETKDHPCYSPSLSFFLPTSV